MRKLSDTFRFIAKDLASDGWRTVITVINLTVFLSCFFSLAALAESAISFGDQPTDQSALLIISRNIFDPSESIVTDQEFIPAQEMMPGTVKKVTPLIFKVFKVNENLMQVRAARLEDMESVHSLQLMGGDWPRGTNEIVIAEGTTALYGWNIGESVHIYGSDFKIAGIVRAAGTQFGSIWMTLEGAESLFAEKGVYQFAWIQLQSGVDGESVKTKLQTDPRLADRFDVYFADSLYQEYTKAVADMGGVSGTLVLLSLVAVMLGTYGSIFLILTERGRDITILRAVGFQSGSIRALIIVRTLLQVLIGYILSWGLTSVILLWFNKINPLMLHSIQIPVVISVRVLLIGAALTLIFGWFGVMIPTRHLRTRSVASFIHS